MRLPALFCHLNRATGIQRGADPLCGRRREPAPCADERPLRLHGQRSLGGGRSPHRQRPEPKKRLPQRENKRLGHVRLLAAIWLMQAFLHGGVAGPHSAGVASAAIAREHVAAQPALLLTGETAEGMWPCMVNLHRSPWAINAGNYLFEHGVTALSQLNPAANWVRTAQQIQANPLGGVTEQALALRRGV